MAREHFNHVIMAGPLSQFKAQPGQDKYGNTKTSFLVGTGAASIRVSVPMKKKELVSRAQSSRSVIVTNGYMNGWYKQEDGGAPKLITNVGGRESGIQFTDQMVEPYSQATVEGYLGLQQDQWLILKSSYMVPSEKITKYREIPVLLPSMFRVPDRAQVMVIGVPKPKFGDTWYAHVEAVRFWVL